MDAIQSLQNFNQPAGMALPVTPKSELEKLNLNVFNLIASQLPMEDIAKMPRLGRRLKQMTNNTDLWKYIAARFNVNVPAGADTGQIRNLVKEVVEPTRVKGKNYFLGEAFGNPVFHIPKGTDPHSIPSCLTEQILRAVPGPAVMYFPLSGDGIGSYGYKDKDGQITFDVIDPRLPPRFVPVDAKNIQIVDDLPSIPEAPFMQQTSKFIVEGSLGFPWLCPTCEMSDSEIREMARSALTSFPGLAYVQLDDLNDIVLYKDTDGLVKEITQEKFAAIYPALSKTHTEMYYLIG